MLEKFNHRRSKTDLIKRGFLNGEIDGKLFDLNRVRMNNGEELLELIIMYNGYILRDFHSVDFSKFIKTNILSKRVFDNRISIVIDFKRASFLINRAP
jgi:hypothetical protein